MLCCFEGHLEPVAFSVPQTFTAVAAAVRLPLSTDPAIETEAWCCFPFTHSLCLSGTLVLAQSCAHGSTQALIAHMGSRQFGLTHDHNMLLEMGEVRHRKLTNRERENKIIMRFSTHEDRLIMVRVGELDMNTFFLFLQNHLVLIHAFEKHGTKHPLLVSLIYYFTFIIILF